MLLKFFSNGKTCFVSVFNAIVRVCIQDLPDALEEILAVPLGKDEEKQPLPATSKKWKKLRLIIKTYLTDLLQVRLNSPFFSILKDMVFIASISTYASCDQCTI